MHTNLNEMEQAEATLGWLLSEAVEDVYEVGQQRDSEPEGSAERAALSLMVDSANDELDALVDALQVLRRRIRLRRAALRGEEVPLYEQPIPEYDDVPF